MTPQEIKTIQKVAHRLAPKYTFGFYDAEDIEQECFLLASEALDKYNPKLGSLENFLFTHLSNRLKNFLRKHYYRQTFYCKYCKGENPECEYCERRRWRFAVKKHLMEPIDIDRINCDREANTYENYDPLEKMELDEVFSIINQELEIPLRIDYLRMLEGLHVPKPKREFIEERIMEILEGHGYGE